MTMVELADKNDIQHSIMMAAILLLIGFTGFILIFIMQRFRAARSSLSRMKIFSDNLVENMPVGLIALDNNNTIISVNPAAETLLSSKLQGSQKKKSGLILPKNLMDLVQSTHFKSKPIEKEIRIRNEKGTVQHKRKRRSVNV